MTEFGVSCADAHTRLDRRNLRVFNIWMIAAALSFATATILLGKRFIDRGAISWTLAVFIGIRRYGSGEGR